jgi:ketosteroid isomerase-like protein
METACTNYATDESRIVDIINTMYDAISWSDASQPDFQKFTAAVRSDAVVVPSTRPAAPTDIAAFVERMSALHANGTMKTFEETGLKNRVKVFGNVAVAIGSFRAKIDGSVSRGVNAFLFIREAGDWQIAAMAWDNESASTPLIAELT